MILQGVSLGVLIIVAAPDILSGTEKQIRLQNISEG